jgi:hypothetical protein
MKNRNFTVAGLENNPLLLSRIIGSPGFMAIADADDGLNLIAIMNPINQHLPDAADELLHSAFLLAASGQLYRACKQLFDRFDPSRSDEDEMLLEKWKRLQEYIEGKTYKPEFGARVELPVFFE